MVFMRYKLTVLSLQWLKLLLGMLINEAAVDVPSSVFDFVSLRSRGSSHTQGLMCGSKCCASEWCHASLSCFVLLDGDRKALDIC